MPIHHRIAPIIGPAIFNQVVRNFNRYSKFDKKMWKNLYPDKGARLGVQHGLSGGAALGSFINDDGNDFNSGSVPFSNASNKSYKARGGFSNRRSSKRANYSGACRCKRQSRSKYSFRRKSRKYY